MSVCTAHAKMNECNLFLPSYGTINTNTAILGLPLVEKTPPFDIVRQTQKEGNGGHNILDVRI